MASCDLEGRSVQKLGTVLRQARLDAGLSLRDLSRASGLTASQISQIETGKRPDPGFHTVTKAAKALGISLDDLAAGCGYVEASNKSNNTVAVRQILGYRRVLTALKAAAMKIADDIDAVIEPKKRRNPRSSVTRGKG